jgi:hypothetical protein
MIKRFLADRRPGFYVAVSEGSEVGTGDEVSRDPDFVSIVEILRSCVAKAYAATRWLGSAAHWESLRCR